MHSHHALPTHEPAGGARERVQATAEAHHGNTRCLFRSLASLAMIMELAQAKMQVVGVAVIAMVLVMLVLARLAGSLNMASPMNNPGVLSS